MESVSDSPFYSIGNSLNCIYRRSNLPSAHERFIFNTSMSTSSKAVSSLMGVTFVFQASMGIKLSTMPSYLQRAAIQNGQLVFYYLGSNK